MAVYIGHDECQVIYVAKTGRQRRVSSVWVGDQQVFPPANRQEIHVFTRDTQGYEREEDGTRFAFGVPVPWWAESMDVVLIGAGEKGRDGTKSVSGGSDGAGGRSGAWVVKTVALNQSNFAVVYVGKGTTTATYATSVYLPGAGGLADVLVHDGEGTRTPNSGSTGGSVTPQSRIEFGQSHWGGAGGSLNNLGKHPGGGGGGGQGANLLANPRAGRDGGDGYVWLRFRSDGPIGDAGALYLGVTSGDASQAVGAWAESIGKTRETITEITVPVQIVAPVMDSAFAGCASLASLPEMDTSQVTNTQFMLYDCSSLTTVPPMDLRKVREAWWMFSGCTSLAAVTLPRLGEGFAQPQTLDMKDTKLNATAANALMQSLGTVPAAANGTKLELPATATGADTSIATAKNWTVTIG